MAALKEEIQTMIANLPDECTIEDIQYHLYVIEKIQNGMQDIENEKTFSQSEAEVKLAKWL